MGGLAGSWARVGLVAFVTVVVVLIALRLSWPALVQHLIYPGGTLDPDRRHPSAWGLEGEDVTLVASDGVRLHAWWIPARPYSDARCGAALYLHGNAETIATRGWIARRLAQRGYDVLLVDYRGYGLSEGEPSEDGLGADARAAWSHLVEDRGADPDRLLVMGHSLGSAVAARLVLERGAGAVILGSPFPGMPAVFRAHAPWLPLPALGWREGRFEAAARLREVAAPVLLLAGTGDRVIPPRLSRAVHRHAHHDGGAAAARSLVEVPAGHDAIMGHPDAWRAIDAFLGEHLCRDDR